MVSFLFVLGLSALISPIVAQELPMDDPVPIEKRVQIRRLSNGVKSYVQSHPIPTGCCSLRVVLKTPMYGEEQLSFDGVLDSEEKIDHFFAFCEKKILKIATKEENFSNARAFSSSVFSSLYTDRPTEVAVIAVGDFDEMAMQGWIDKYFGGLVLGELDLDASASAIHIGQDETISKGLLSLFYRNLRRPIVTYEDLKESWKYLLLQELFQKRMERCSRGIEEAWVHPHPRFFYPVSGYAFVSEEEMENLLSFLLWQVEIVRNDGFFEDEFYIAKNQLVNQLQYLASNVSRPDDIFLASYYVDQFLLGDSCLSYDRFLEASASLVEQIQVGDLFPCLEPFFLDDRRGIHVMHPKPGHSEIFTRQRVEEVISRVASLASFYRNSEMAEESFWTLDTDEEDSSRVNYSVEADKGFAFAKPVSNQENTSFRLADHAKVSQVNNAVNATESFFSLPLDEREKRFIHSIISTIADKNLVQLVFERGNLEKKGKKIHHVHPLRFMGYILSTPALRAGAKEIRKSSFKWDAFISGFAKRMREELSKGNVYQHLPGFAKQVGSTPEHVKPYVHEKDFEGLVKSLL